MQKGWKGRNFPSLGGETEGLHNSLWTISFQRSRQDRIMKAVGYSEKMTISIQPIRNSVGTSIPALKKPVGNHTLVFFVGRALEWPVASWLNLKIKNFRSGTILLCMLYCICFQFCSVQVGRYINIFPHTLTARCHPMHAQS
jgi:hypothetical protein